MFVSATATKRVTPLVFFTRISTALRPFASAETLARSPLAPGRRLCWGRPVPRRRALSWRETVSDKVSEASETIELGGENKRIALLIAALALALASLVTLARTLRAAAPPLPRPESPMPPAARLLAFVLLILLLLGVTSGWLGPA